MIFDPLPVKFLPQKNCWYGPKIALFSVVNCPGAKNGVIKNFCCTKKWPRRGQKIKKKIFFQKKYSKDGKNKFWDLWDHFWQKSILADMSRTLDPTPPTPPLHQNRPRQIGLTERAAEICNYVTIFQENAEVAFMSIVLQNQESSLRKTGFIAKYFEPLI